MANTIVKLPECTQRLIGEANDLSENSKNPLSLYTSRKKATHIAKKSVAGEKRRGKKEPQCGERPSLSRKPSNHQSNETKRRSLPPYIYKRAVSPHMCVCVTSCTSI